MSDFPKGRTYKTRSDFDLYLLSLKAEVGEEFFNDIYKLIDSANTVKQCPTCKKLLQIVNEFLS
jgi:hypothetical protein